MPLHAVHETALLIVCGLLLVMSVRDVAFRTIPNSLCAGLAVAALAGQPDWGSLAGALLSGGGVFLLALLCWQRGWLGGGDVKLLAASAMLVTPAGLPGFLAAVMFAGGGLAVTYLVLSFLVRSPEESRPARLVRRIARAERWRISRRQSLPYACAISMGAIITLMNG